ncbi:MAG TPA: hypothetical protein VJZ76_10465 [Thermoanaerobaculia bacterium]|nr:hypothetical protein [Thermoanaerobaculia bacterium]
MAIVLLLVAACARHETKTTPPPAQPTQAVPAAPTAAVPKPRGVSTPAKCAGDGSYDQAVECFRMSSGFRFRVTSPELNANGTLQRPRIGEETLTIGEWTGESKHGAIVWTKGGKPATPTPELERLYQRLTIYLDPQKKEGTPQLVDSSGNANHYHFTDANSGEVYDVYVAKDDGRMTRFRAGKTEISLLALLFLLAAP